VAATGECRGFGPLGATAMQSLGGVKVDERTAVIVGLAGAGVAAAELRSGTTPVAHAATSPSPLPGDTAGERFFAIEHPVGALTDELATLDATGICAAGPTTSW
jgi:hypothetical protein